MRKNNLLYQI